MLFVLLLPAMTAGQYRGAGIETRISKAA